MAEVNLDIVVNNKQAQKSIKSFSATATKSLKSIESSFTALKAVAIGAVGFIAGRQIVRGLDAITDAAAVQEDAINQLNIALQLSGQYSEQASQDMQDFASSLQATTRFGDEVILQNAALIQSLGQLDQEGLKEATKAAADLSAALGIDLATASNLVGKAAAGEVGTFSRYGLAIEKGASKSATFANALEAINEKFGGAAAKQINTYSGAVEQLSNVQGDLLEELGFLITKNPVVIQGIKLATEGFQQLIKIVKNNQEEIGAFVTKGFKAVISIIPSVIRSLGFFAKAFNGIQLAVTSGIFAVTNFVKAVLEFNIVKTIANTIADAFRGLGTVVVSVIGGIFDLISKIPGASIAFDKLGFNIDDTVSSLDDLGASLVDSFGEDAIDYDKTISSLNDISNAALNIGGDTDLLFQKILEGVTAVADLSEEQVKKLQESLDTAAKAIKPDAAAGGEDDGFDFSKAFDGVAAGFKQGVENLGKQIKEVGIGKIATGIFSGILKGAEGAKKILTTGISAIGEAFFPGFGSAIGEIAGLLMQGPEQTRKMVKEFFEALPDLIVNMVEGLIEAAPAIIDAFVDSLLIRGGLFRIVDALIRATPRIGLAMGEALLRVISVENLQKTFNELGRQIAGGFLGDFNAKFKWPSFPEFSWPEFPQIKAPDWLNRLKIETPDWLNRLKIEGPDIGGGGGTLGQIGRSIGLADGGIVPGGYPNDSFQARLTSGEMVVRPNTTENLFNLIDKLSEKISSNDQSNQQGQMTINLQIGEQQLANVLLDLNRGGFRTSA